MLRNWRENGRFVEDKELEGKRPLFVKNLGQPSVPKPAQSLGVALGKGVGNCGAEREEVLTTLPPDAGAMPRTACALVISKGISQPRQRR